MLLDFTLDIDCESDQAGRIEAMLEDAGLLDALVVAPSQAALADELLAAEGLSDCRLDIEGIDRLIQAVGASAQRSEARFNPSRPAPMYRPAEENTSNGHDGAHFYGLRFDTAVNSSFAGTNPDW